MKYLVTLVLLFCLLPVDQAEAACTGQIRENAGTYETYSNSCENDNEVLIQTNDSRQHDACFIMSSTGAVDVFVSLDGTNYSTVALALTDFGASNTDPASVTVAGRVYAFAAKFRNIRVLQNGATDTVVSMICWSY